MWALPSAETGAINSHCLSDRRTLICSGAIDPKLEQVVDFGWFSFIAKPLFLTMNWLNDKYVHNYGWSIILVTILINTLLLPLKISGMKSMRKMSSLQPQIAGDQREVQEHQHARSEESRAKPGSDGFV